MPRLLHADENQLRMAAAALARGGRLVVVVVDRSLWQAAASFLAGLLPGHRLVIHDAITADATSQAIDDPRRDQVNLTIVIRIPDDALGSIQALNLRRERLSRAAANFVIVLGGTSTYSLFLTEAPDCYSYRDLLVTLEGEPTVERVDTDDTEWLSLAQVAQSEPDPRARAQRLWQIADRLRAPFHQDTAYALRGLAIDALSSLPSLTDEDRLFLAMMYMGSAATRTQRHRRVRRACEILAPIAERYPIQFADIEAGQGDALGIELDAVRDVVHRTLPNHGWLGRWLFWLATAYIARDDIVRARTTLSQIPERGEFWMQDTALLLEMRAMLLIEAGAWDAAARVLSGTQPAELAGSPHRALLDRRRALLLRRRGEAAAARRILQAWSSPDRIDVVQIDLAADDGEIGGAIADLQRAIDAFPAPGLRHVDELIQAHHVLLELTEREIAGGGSTQMRDALDLRIAALHERIAQSDERDPSWNVIEALLLEADAHLHRSDGERRALPCAERARKIADDRSTILLPKILRRLIVAGLRLGDLEAVSGWLAEGLARAEQHEHLGEQARLHGLALWHCTASRGDVAGAEARMAHAIQATGSALIDASVRYKIGCALGRADLLRRAQEIYRSLPWPEREAACLEALGQRRIAEVRYRSFGLVQRLRMLDRRVGPPVITVNDDAWTE